MDGEAQNTKRMMNMNIVRRTFLVVLLASLLSASSKSFDNKSRLGVKQAQQQPPPDIYSALARELLHRNVALKHLYTENKVKRAINTLSTAQSAWQTMDSATHSLKNAFQETSSLSNRFNRFVKKKSRNTKEAAKLAEYVALVERGLQACEILQAVTMSQRRQRQREVMLDLAGLREVETFTVTRNSLKGNSIRCKVSVLVATDKVIAEEHSMDEEEELILRQQPHRFAKDEVIVCITNINTADEEAEKSTRTNKPKMTKKHLQKDDILFCDEVRAVMSMMRLVSDEAIKTIPLPLPHPALSLNEKENEPPKVLEVQPTLFRLAVDVCDRLAPTLFNMSFEPVRTKNNDKITYFDNDRNETNLEDINGLRFRHLKIRFIGHSLGGAVASLSAMILDGLLDPSLVPSLVKNSTASYCMNGKIIGSIAGTNQTLPIVGGFNQRVKCMTFGAPPCVSRTVVPAYISSLICGDDIMTRLKVSSIKSFQSRVTDALEGGAGLKGLAWITAPSLLTKVAGKNVKKYKIRKQEVAGLHVPGRTFYIKSRKLKQGATLQRILRGNWQEEVLWNIHDVVITKKMVEHHTINAYIRTLNRC